MGEVESAASLELELRKLKARDVQILGQILSSQNDWKIVMAHILRDPENPQSPRKFTGDQVEVIATEAHRCGKCPFEILVDEWGTMGRNRPRLWYLLRLFLDVEQARAASHVTEHMLRVGPLTEETRAVVEDLIKPYQDGRKSTRPVAPPITRTDFDEWDRQIEEDLLNLDEADSNEELNSDLLTMPGPFENAITVPNVPFAYLQTITGDFGRLAGSEDRFIGAGGFAVVYKGVTLRSSQELAIKKLNSDQSDALQRNEFMVNFEVGELTRLKHKCIIEILGYSNDKADSPCLIYPYLSNGNLEDRLQLKRGPSELLGQIQRYAILIGVAEGLAYLHNQPKPLIHRDVKTSNILLDQQLLPKIADFGLLRHASTNNTETVNIMGTARYMAPEAIRGDIHVKIDVFSFGAVILEVLTGLASLDKKRAEIDIITHVQESLKDDTSSVGSEADVRFLDPKIPDWTIQPAKDTFHLALDCLQDKWKRPFMDEVHQRLLLARSEQDPQ